jgi:hypothetical protein
LLKFKFGFLFLITFLLYSCNTYREGFTVYEIQENRHFCSGWRWGLSRTPYRKFEFVLDSSCVYDETSTGKAWSKIGGFTTGHTHWNSCRVGWQSENGHIALGYYCYVGGKRIAGKMTEAMPGEVNQAELFWDKSCRSYVVRINGIEEIIPQPRNMGFYLYTYPFLGGRFKAPQNMAIRIRNLNPEAAPLWKKWFAHDL